MPQEKLRFQISDNAKISRQLKRYATFSLPSGHACPGAHACLARADRKTGKITDGKDQDYRCFSATMEARLPSVRINRWHNFDILQRAARRGGQTEMQKLLMQGLTTLPSDIMIIRHGVGGDLFSQAYFDAWLDCMLERPDLLLYAYTKSLPYWVARLPDIPDNFRLTASRGSRWDHLIDLHDLRSATVVGHPDEAAWHGLEIDHDDSHAYADTSPVSSSSSSKSFALLLHGTQRKGSRRSEQMKRLKQEELTDSYV